MSSQVIHHISFCPKTKPAFLRAGKRTRIKMDEHVGLQVLFFREGLVAVGHRTLERLSSEVHVHMSSVPIKSSKRFLTLITSVLACCLFLRCAFLLSGDIVEIFGAKRILVV